MNQALSQSVSILVLSVVLGVLSFFVRPETLPWDISEHEIELPEVLGFAGVVWIDARIDEDFEAAHLDTALLLNEENWEEGFAPLLDAWVPGTPIVVYCSSQSCLRSHHVAERLREELGVEEVYSLKGGWESLVEAGLVEGGEQ